MPASAYNRHDKFQKKNLRLFRNLKLADNIIYNASFDVNIMVFDFLVPGVPPGINIESFVKNRFMFGN